ncbi:organic cation transporter protein-like [Drosophila nasuta]|uniref:organic cation transporter protein-like n=1 Tax=Drosophila nasuta TaxID=42062 RepID=UPI00295E7946|nr:organic cation transporter protein-like [Drosophila nasuta]
MDTESSDDDSELPSGKPQRVDRGQQTGDLSIETNITRWSEVPLFFDFDDLLPEIGEFGLYQKILFVLMIPFCFIASFVYLSQIFMTLPPENYYCFVHELTLIESEEERKMLSIPKEADGSYSHCRMYDLNYSAVYLAKNRSEYINDSLAQLPCRQSYVYDDPFNFRTASMEFNWVCDKDAYSTYAQMIFFFGSVVGCLGYGHLADRVGRVSALVSSCGLALFGSIFSSVCDNFAGFAITRFVVGASFDTCFTMIYILVLEYVGPRYRTFVANMSLAMFYSPFTVLMPWLAFYSGDWRKFSGLYGLAVGFGLIGFCVLPESARWLVSVGKIDNAIEILQRVARRNRRQVSRLKWQTFRESCEQFYREEIEGRHFTIASIFKRSRLARYMVLMIIIWMTISLVYDGHVRAASVLDRENIFVVFSIACATEIPGDLIVTITLDRFGRRWCACISTALSGGFSLLAANIDDPIWVLAAALAGRFFANISYNIGLQWAAEVLPTVVRAQGVSFIHTLGFVAMLLSPPIIYMSHLSIALMLNTLGVLGILGGLLALFLPETLHQDLPQTLSDGNQFGKDQRIWHFPCCGAGSRPSRLNKHDWHQGSSLRTLSKDEYRSRKLHRVAVVKTQRRTTPVVLPSMVSDDSTIMEKLQKSYRFLPPYAK